MSFPSFEEVAQSPRLEQPGIKVVLGGTSFKAHDPVTLYGTYVADGAFLAKCHGEPDTWIMITAIARDMPGIWYMPLLSKPNLAPTPIAPQPAAGTSFRQTGFFNLDLRQHLELPIGPSRYWLVVSMGDYISDRISFELR